MKLIALTPTKGGKHEPKSTYLNFDIIHSLDSEITEGMRERFGLDENTKTIIELKAPENATMPVAETVQKIMEAARAAGGGLSNQGNN